MKYISVLLILSVTTCNFSEQTQSITIASKETEYIEIKDFPDNLKA